MHKLTRLFLNRAVDNLRLRYDATKDSVELFLTADGYGLIRKDGKDTLIPASNILYMELTDSHKEPAPVKSPCAGCAKKKA
jgi:hypothetical protein